MRLSEKTIELNFCSQFQAAIGRPIFWFGLTQSQEAKAGFDACVRMAGRLLIFQFKASNHELRDGSKRFIAHHDQMVRLKNQARGRHRSVFYVLPSIGTTADVPAHGHNLLSHSWLLDVATLPNPIPRPTTRAGGPRISRIHYIDIRPPNAIMHSEPEDIEIIKADDFVNENMQLDGGLSPQFFEKSERRFLEFCKLLSRPSVALLIADLKLERLIRQRDQD